MGSGTRLSPEGHFFSCQRTLSGGCGPPHEQTLCQPNEHFTIICIHNVLLHTGGALLEESTQLSQPLPAFTMGTSRPRTATWSLLAAILLLAASGGKGMHGWLHACSVLLWPCLQSSLSKPTLPLLFAANAQIYGIGEDATLLGQEDLPEYSDVYDGTFDEGEDTAELLVFPYCRCIDYRCGSSPYKLVPKSVRASGIDTKVMCFTLLYVGCPFQSECCNKIERDVGKIEWSVGGCWPSI